MLRMEKAMEERGTPVRHACFYRKDKPYKSPCLWSTESLPKAQATSPSCSCKTRAPELLSIGGSTR